MSLLFFLPVCRQAGCAYFSYFSTMLLISNAKNAAGLARKLQANFAQVEEVIYPDGEIALKISKNIKTGAGKEKIIVFFRFSPAKSFDEQIFNLFSLLDYINNKKNLALILPYLPYARSLPLETGREINKLGFFLAELSRRVNRLYFIQPHCRPETVKKYLRNASAREVKIEKSIVKFLKRNFRNFVLVAPDHGFALPTEKLAGLARKHYIVLEKERLTPQQVRIKCTDKKLTAAADKQFIIIDDITSTGGTLLKAAGFLRERGVEKIACFVVHNLLRDQTAINQFKRQNIKIFSTNSLDDKRAAVNIFDDIYEELK